MGGYIMQLQNYSVNDGEGIRTNVFLAGCPLRCLWCSNPEGQTIRNPMTRYMETEEIIEQVKKQMIFYRNSGGGVTFSGGEATVQAEFLERTGRGLLRYGNIHCAGDVWIFQL
ncbi:MAG: 4Fe-4S cluster-binding domain-containing protein [[Clostridium] scindens]